MGEEDLRYFPNYLAHEGVKERSGRYKWGSGKRPYQRLGGPAGGAKKIGGPTADNAKKKNSSEETAKSKSTTINYQKITNGAKTANSSLKNIGNEIGGMRSKRAKNKYYEQAKHMSDSEMQKVIKRKNLERSYADAMTSGYGKSGYDTAMRIIGITGGVVGIGSGIVTIHEGLKKK